MRLRLQPLHVFIAVTIILAAVLLVWTWSQKSKETQSDQNVSSAHPTPKMEETIVQFHAILNDGTRVPINLVDKERQKDTVAIYTSQYGAEFSKPFDADTVEVVISKGMVAEVNTDGSKGTYIPADGYVLSASGQAKQTLADLPVGQTIQLENFEPPVQKTKYFTLNGVTVPIGVINATRGGSEVVLFQPSFGPSTNTNEWGMELVVENGKITQLTEFGGKTRNDTVIPAQGYVLSIPYWHESFKQLDKKVKVGDEVKLVVNPDSPYLISKNTFDMYNSDRGPNQMIIYDIRNGPTSGTNPWGYEVVVNEDHKVIAVGGNNLTIPAKGYVISGNGDKATWLQQNVQVGATINIKAVNDVMVMFTPHSYVDRATIKLNHEIQRLEASKAQFLDVPYREIESKIEQSRGLYGQVKEAVETKSYNLLSGKMAEFDEAIDTADYMNYESRKVENRGLWLAPLEQNTEQVKRAVQKIAAANLNQVYLDTNPRGYTIYPTNDPLAPEDPMFHGFDVLQAYIDECKKYNIEVHALVQNFFRTDRPLDQKPKWAMISRKGDNFQLLDNTKFYWLNPALPEVQDYILSTYIDRVKRYDLDGLHMDYIRYPDSFDTTNDYGYDDYTRTQFRKKTGIQVDPIDLQPGMKGWEEWVQFRVDVISNFAYRVEREIKRIKPNLAYSAAVYSEFDQAPAYKHQSVKDWLARNVMDNVLPMSYKFDVSSVSYDAQKALDMAGDKSYVTMGFGPSAGVSKPILVQQVDATHRMGTSGSAFFEYWPFFANRYDKELTMGVFRNKAIVPYSHPGRSIQMILEDMTRKMETIYVPNGGMVESGSYAKAIADVGQLIDAKDLNAKSAESVKNGLNRLMDQITNDSSIHANVRERMQADVKYGLKIINIYLNK